MSSKYRSGQFADPKGVVVEGPTIDHGVLAEGTTVPADGTAGYESGCLFLSRSATALAGLQCFVNEGSVTSCDFNAVATRESQAATRVVNATAASLTVTAATHGDRIITLNLATGVAVTLPAFTGSGFRYSFFVGTAVSGGSHVISATGAFLFGGVYLNTDTAVVSLFTAVAAANAAGSTTFTMNGSTQGGRVGDWVEITDLGTNVGWVRGSLNGSGTEATPFS